MEGDLLRSRLTTKTNVYFWAALFIIFIYCGMRNNPRNVIYYYSPRDPTHHRVLEKRRIFERSMTQASSFSSPSRDYSQKNRSDSTSVRKIETVLPSAFQTPVRQRTPIFKLPAAR